MISPLIIMKLEQVAISHYIKCLKEINSLEDPKQPIIYLIRIYQRNRGF